MGGDIVFRLIDWCDMETGIIHMDRSNGEVRSQEYSLAVF